MNSLTKEQKIYYALRVAAAMCFIGHGTFGIITKAIWCNYFAVFGIGHDLAYRLMPILGAADILMGLSLLIYPVRAVAVWLVGWGLVTAALRPMSGEPFAELVERAGNFGAPMALLLLCGTEKNFRSWFKKIQPPDADRAAQLKTVRIFLQCITFLLLAGHGWLNLIGKKGLLGQYTTLGFHDAHQVALTAGLIEIAMALLILIKPYRPALLIILVWKIGTELFYPRWEALEWIERGGSYGTLLALWFALQPGALTDRLKGGFARNLSYSVVLSIITIGPAFFFVNHFVSSNASQSYIDQRSLSRLAALDQQNHNATFVFVDPGFTNQVTHNKVILLEPIGKDLRIDINKYQHKGHFGHLYIILPEDYAGPKEKMILKSFPAYKGWFGSMLTDNYVMYATW
jgi:hypothetical protein